MVKQNDKQHRYYWIAVNGASAAASPLPLGDNPTVSPTPEQLIGFTTQQEQLAVQKKLLTAPIEEVTAYMTQTLRAKCAKGEIRYIRPANPEPPTELTMWLM